MFDIIKKLRAVPDTAVSLRRALAEIEAALPDAEAAVIAAEQARAAGLLDLGDAEMEKVERVLAQAVRNRDRLIAGRDDTERRAVAAEAAEAKAALDREMADIEARAAKLAGTMRRRYDKAAAEIVTLLTEIVAAEEAIRDLNRRLHEAGRGAEALIGVEKRDNRLDETVTLADNLTLTTMTSIRASENQPGWNAGRVVFATLGRLP